MRVLVLGCGRFGSQVGRRLLTEGHAVQGVRRSHAATAPFPIICADAADPTAWSGDWQAVLLCATPGLRHGADNGLAHIVTLVRTRLPNARLVYTGTTAVYADAGGAAVDESGEVTGDALLAIEQAVLAQPDALVLRLTALTGRARDRAVTRARAAKDVLHIPGDPERPFSIIHEDDAALIASAALTGPLRDQRGILNAAAPLRLSARAYYAEAVRLAGVTCPIASDGTSKPSRIIDASRLWRLMPNQDWRGPWD